MTMEGENKVSTLEQPQSKENATETTTPDPLITDQFFHVKLVLIGTQPHPQDAPAPNSPRRINSSGCDFRFQELVVGTIRIKQQIWEITYEETHFSILSFYLPGTQCAIISYDVNKRESFEKALQWIEEVSKRCPSAFILLAGTIMDPANEEREVDAKEAMDVVQRVPTVLKAVEIDGSTEDDLDELLDSAALKVVELQLLTRQIAQRKQAAENNIPGKKPKKVKVKKPIKQKNPCKVM